MGDSRSSKRVVLRRGKRAEGLSGQLHFASHYATRLPPSAASHRSAVTGDRTAQHPWGSRLDRPAAVSFEAQRTRSGISATSAIGRRIDGDVTTAVAVAGGSDRSLGGFHERVLVVMAGPHSHTETSLSQCARPPTLTM